MRGWSSILVGVALLGIAAWAHLTGMFSGAAIVFGLPGAFLVYRGFQGVEILDAGDPTALGDFISNPAEALVDAAVDKGGEYLSGRRKVGSDEPSGEAFDADAALARYMANRPASAPPLAVEAVPPVRGFGRKGL